jgi:hypothetical protein
MRLVLLAAIVASMAAAGAAGAAGTAAAAPGTQLRVTVWPAGQPGAFQSWTLACAPAGGNHPARTASCRTVARVGVAGFRPVPPRTMCTQVYGGPQQALVTGVLDGRRIWARFNLRDGCQIARWKRLAPLLPAAAS